MIGFLSPDFDGSAFRLLGARHLLAVGAVIVTAYALIRVARAGEPARRRRIALALTLVLVLNEIAWHLWNLLAGSWTIQRMLPLHLCSAMVWITAGALLFEQRTLYPLLYFCGIAGAAQALITPDLGAFGFPHYRFFQTMLGHGLLVTAGVWVVTAEQWRPTLGALCRVTLGLNAYALVVLWVNLRTGSNYLYLTGRPESVSLLDFLPDWPWYLAIAEGMAITIFTLMYLRFRASRDRP